MNTKENIKKIIVKKPLKLDCGKTISDYPLAYETYAKPNLKNISPLIFPWFTLPLIPSVPKYFFDII